MSRSLPESTDTSTESSYRHRSKNPQDTLSSMQKKYMALDGALKMSGCSYSKQAHIRTYTCTYTYYINISYLHVYIYVSIDIYIYISVIIWIMQNRGQ